MTLTQRNAPAGIEKLQEPPAHKPPLHIPSPWATGTRRPPLPLSLEGQAPADTVLLELTSESQTWVLRDIPEEPVPSLLRNFSAPVIVEFERPTPISRVLARHDTDPFARWEATRELASRQLLCLGAMPASTSTQCSSTPGARCCVIRRLPIL